MFCQAVPDLGAWLGVSESTHKQTYTATSNYHMHDGIATQAHMSFNHISLTGPVSQPFTSHYEGPRFNPQGGTYVKPGFSC